MDDAGDPLTSPARLRPEMSSRRLQVLAFVRAYVARYRASPSHGEIASHCGVSRTLTRRHLNALVRDGYLLRRPGARGLSLPDEQAEALRRLRDLGWAVDERARQAAPPPPGERCANVTLLPPPALDYHSRDATGDCDGERRD